MVKPPAKILGWWLLEDEMRSLLLAVGFGLGLVVGGLLSSSDGKDDLSVQMEAAGQRAYIDAKINGEEAMGREPRAGAIVFDDGRVATIYRW